MMTDTMKPIKIFISYSHKDKKHLDELKTHLRPLERQGFIDLWRDKEVPPGTEWEQVIAERLNTADLILLLISPDFMASDYCYNREMKRALERHKHERTYVVPILLRSYPWQSTSLAQFDVLPKDHIPITESPDPEEAFCDVAKEVRYLVENLNINEWRDKGNELYKQGKYKDALLFYEKIRLLKNSVSASTDLATVFNDLEAYKEALHVYDVCLHAAKTDRPSWKTKNSIDKHKYREALQVYELIFQRNVSQKSAALEDPQLGMAQENIPHTIDRSSLEQLNQAIQRSPINPFLYHLKGNILFQLEQYREALGAYEQAIQLQEGFDLTRQYLFATLEKISQLAYRKFDTLARQDLQKARQLRDEHNRDS